jgi:hypothetical protein
MRWLGYGLTMVCVAQMLLSVSAKFFLPSGVPEHFASLGWQLTDVHRLAFLELGLTVLYLIPRTCVWGVILLTGYLGGATAAHVRISDGVFLYPLVLGAGLWIALLMRSPQVWKLLR